MSSLSEKVVLVTGASSGIGRATAVHLAGLGAKLALTGRNKENLQRVGEQCEKLGKHPPVLIVGDLSNERDVEEIVESTIRHYHTLDVLVNSAGVFELGSIENTNVDQYDRMFSVNVRAVYHLTMLAVPHLVRSKGAIVNVSSVNGSRSFAGCLAYNLSKSAVDQFTKSVALELAGQGVRVNSVNPGVVLTPQKKARSSKDAAYAAFLERTRVAHALGRLGEPEEVARAIAFLASDQSTFVTGANLPVDGGRHVMCPGGIQMGVSQVDPTLSSF